MASDSGLMTEGSVTSKILKFAFPVFLGMLFQQLYNAADSIIVGNFIGSSALAAVSSTGNLIFMIVGFFNGIAVGAGVVIARHIGARDSARTVRSVHTTVAVGLISSLLVMVIGILFTPLILRAMSTPAEVMQESVTYLRIYFAGALGFVMYNALVGILQAAGDSRHPLYYLISASIINILLDLILIGYFHFGVGAAAFATDVSQILSALLALNRLRRVDADYRVRLSQLRIDRAEFKLIIKNGLPSGFQNSVMSLSNVVIQSHVNSFGAAAVAGIGAYTKVEGFGFLPVTAFAMALTTYVSQNLGAHKIDRVQKGVRFGIVTTCIMAEILGMMLYIFAPQAVALFDRTPEVIMYGVQRAHFIGPLFFLCSFTHAMAAVMRGSGKSMVPMFIFLFCWCVLRVLIMTISGLFIHSIYTTHLVYPITWTVSSIASYICYRRMDYETTLTDF